MLKFRKDEFLRPLIYSTNDEYETGCHVTKEIVDDVEQLQQKIDQLEQDKTHLIEIISGLISYVKNTYDEDLTDKTAEVMEIVLDKVGDSDE